MVRIIIKKYRLYVEGKREYLFFNYIIKITNNTKKYTDPYNLNGGGHRSMLETIQKDNFQGERIWIVDNRDNKIGSNNINLSENKDLLEFCKNENIDYVISDKNFDDEIIDFLDISNTEDSSKKSIDKYLRDHNMSFKDFLLDKIKDKNYIKNNLEKIKNKYMKNLLIEILDSYREDDLL